MKKNTFYLTFLLLLLFNNNFYGQEFCQSPQVTTNNLFNNSPLLKNTNNNNSYCLKLYFHVIRRTDGTGGQPISAVNTAFQTLNQDFNVHNISFTWDNTIDYIDNTFIFNSPSPTIYSLNNHQNGIDIYLYDNNAQSGAFANGVGSSSEIFISGKGPISSNIPYVLTHAVSHEMGHVLFLWHTHHGTLQNTAENGNDPSACPELVNGTNSATCGDYVEDTPADPFLNYVMVNPSTCIWSGNGYDTNFDPYQPDTNNMMSNTRTSCMQYFSTLQGSRMRNAIATLPFLQQCVTTCCSGTTADLYLKDTVDDIGLEPNVISLFAWNSPDIWVRNQFDTIETHQSPVYNPNNPNFVYVKVRNKGCIASSGNDVLKVYALLPNWTNPNTPPIITSNSKISNPVFESLNNSSLYPHSYSLQLIGSVNIPVLNNGQNITLSFPWNVPNPSGFYDCTSNNFDTFLYAKVESITDPITFAETNNNYQNIINNNNIAGKNCVLIAPTNLLNQNGGPDTNTFESSFILYNTKSTPINIQIELVKDDNEIGKSIYQEAEITLNMDDIIFDGWQRGGSFSENLIDNSLQNSKKVATNNAVLNDINLLSGQYGKIDIKFNFLIDEYTNKDKYIYNLIVKNTLNNSIIGGTAFIINKPTRNLFNAYAGENLLIDLNEPISITAEEINEPATYNWYDSEGNLVFQGKDLQIANAVAEKYKLEVISTIDGFKDYAEVEVTLKPSLIESVLPNPANNNINISYKLNGVNSAYLMIIGYYGSNNTSNNYILDTNNSEININIENYQNGFYTVALIVNGEIIDAKNLIKQ